MQGIQLPETMVIGVGNILRRDDGFGVHALRRLQADPRTPQDVAFIDGSTLGLELAGYVSGASHLLLLDSVNTGQGAGTPIRMTGDELRTLPGGTSVHQLGVVDLIAMLSFASEESPDIVLLGVQPASTDWGVNLTSRVEAAIAPMVEMAIAQLRAWSPKNRQVFD